MDVLEDVEEKRLMEQKRASADHVISHHSRLPLVVS
jgi:signal transduction histidine kinase